MTEKCSGCGFSVEDPFCFTSAAQEFEFVESLISPAGTRFIQRVKFTCEDSHRVLIDNFTGYYLDENGAEVSVSFYANRYCSKVRVALPDGWSLDIPGKNDKPSSSITMTDKGYGYSAELREVKTEAEFNDLYMKVAMKDMRDFLAALANGYNSGDNHFIWLFGLFDLKRKNTNSAYYKFKRSADAGLPGAQLSLAELLRQHKELGLIGAIKNSIFAALGSYHKNNNEALVWIKKAIAQGYRPAEHVLETWYLEGIVPGDPVENAVSMYLSKAKAGDPYYMLRVSEVYRGRCIFAGVFYKQNLTKRDELAFTWRKRAAEAGNLEAQKLMGDSFHHGWNINADSDEAVNWYKRATDNGHKGALNALIDQLEYGNSSGMPRFKIIDKQKDDDRFRLYLDYYKRASEIGYSLAGMGLMYFINQGYQIERTDEEESRWKQQETTMREELKRHYS